MFNLETFTSHQRIGLIAHAFIVSRLTQLTNDISRVEFILKSAFAPLEALVGNPSIQRSTAGIVITVPYYTYNPLGAFSNNLVSSISDTVSQLLECPVELRIVRLESAYLDADILAQYISAELKNTRFVKLMKTLFSLIGPINPLTTVNRPGAIIGVKVRLAGRLVKEPSRPRQTIQVVSIGTFISKDQHALQSSSYTAINSKGTYTVSVWLSVKV